MKILCAYNTVGIPIHGVNMKNSLSSSIMKQRLSQLLRFSSR